MKKILLGILSLFSVFGAVRAAGPDAPALRESVPFTVREGLPATAAKLDAGEPVTIAYFGGSITEQIVVLWIGTPVLDETTQRFSRNGHDAIGLIYL